MRGPAVESRPWTEYLGVSERAPSAQESFLHQPQEVWRTKVGPAVMGSMAVGDSVLAIQGTDRNLSVLWRATGERVWRARLNAHGATGPLLTATHVLAASGGPRGKLYAFSLQSGRRIWSEQVGPVSGALAQLDALVFAASEAGWLKAHRVETGELAWQRRLPGRIRSGVSVVRGRLIVSTDDTLYQMDPRDGRVARSVATRGTVLNPPAVSGRRMAVSSPDGFVASLDAETLAEHWRVETQSAVFGSPAIARDTVFAVTISGTLWSIPLAPPVAPRHVNLGAAVRAPPAPTAQGILVGTLAGQLLMFDPTMPGPRVRMEMDGPLEQPPVLNRGDLIIADGRGVVQLWR